NTTIEAVVTPEAPLYSPITPIDRNIFLSGGNTIIPESPENSSPVRNMSPDTLKLFETLNHSDFSDDDSVKDPDFIADEDLHNNSSDESTSLTNIVALVHVENSLNSEYCHTSDTTQQPEIIHDNAVSTAIIGDDDIQESQKVDESNSRSHFQVVVSKQLKRRYSENDLQQFHQTHQPLKKLRSASISIACEDRVQKKPKYNTPKKKHISDPSKWKRHIEREKRFKGEAYKTIKEARKKIYESFRTLRTLEAQRQFVIQHVKKEKKKRSTTNGPSRKDFTHHYSFTIGHEKVSVCRDFFLDTLNIKERIIRGALKKVSSEGVLLADIRGKKPPSNKLSNDRFNQIKEHIFSFPAMESHYCRKKTEYKYLDSGLNLKIMYLLYKEKCEEEGTKPAGIETYRKGFRSYKLKFHVPKKDLCKKCVAHKELKSNDMINSEDDNHVFYESGHSHMECDSIHSKIEQKCKNSAVYTPDGWIQVMRLARTNPRPFNVNVLVHEEFLDFNPNQCQFAEEYRKNSPKSIFIKTDYNDDSFKELKIKPKRGKTALLVLAPIYTERIPISKLKKKDLLKLCVDNQIPKYYHSFYQNLPDSETTEDRLPQPDADEAEDL
ncbi:hypothetical protein HW555_012891, partial [Spodoptera exigua]